ncbi:MAG: hypothetical protein GFH27_549281n298 [Chloroflexi bacterium AL-W]|nr:hypothetical protein [Chloroflexi bacterium AL-N1]NOK66183.1 hypothetical protein [Chloroflexi bacterium AL-N10]NOK73064.1 hypothetical protein [Chloroflexi bacterium AL-N5]NOK79961.1 hypothetical protein [Chloroflexi bacterium AL-W]NOK88183.1 hypothetical protein [Chloroflexi bacterium AL-N15]
MADRVLSQSTLENRFARWETLRAAVDDLVRQRPQLLPHSFEQPTRPYAYELYDRGLQSVPIYMIVDQLHSYNYINQRLEFGSHHVLQSRQPHRSRSDLTALSPVALYKVGETYFVKDGNKRVQFARSRGQVFVPAYVTEYVIDTALDGLAGAQRILMYEEHQRFLETTKLLNARPTHTVSCTLLGGYPKLVQHISTHREELQAEWSRHIPRHVAAASWYDTIYLPITHMVRRQHVVAHLDKYVEGDIYLWSMEYYSRLSEAEQRVAAAEQNVVLSATKLREHLRGALSMVIRLGRVLRNDYGGASPYHLE